MKKLLCILMASCLLTGCGQSKTESAAEGDKPEYSCRLMDSYDYTQPVPPSDAIEESYYDDVLMAGDSRMGSLYLYGTHKNAEIDFVTSLNLLMIDIMTIGEEEGGDGTETLMDKLTATRKGNIYLLFGINEIRNPSFDSFAEKYQEILTMLRKNNPNVNIYIILAYHPDYISNLPEPELTAHLNDLNTHLINLAETDYTYYLDSDNGLDDENGTIRDDYTFDGLHFNPTGAAAFQSYIDTHVVRSKTYVKEVCE